MAEHMVRPRSATSVRFFGAACVLAAGVVHLQQYFGVYYRVIPTIGPLFLLDFALSAAAAVALLVPLERIWRPLAWLAALGAVALSAGAIIGLEISENGTLFGFHEHGYRLAVVLALVFEAVSIVSLIGYLIVRRRGTTFATTSHSSDPLHRAMTEPTPPSTRPDSSRI